MVTKFFKEFSGNKAAFIEAGHPATYANNIVLIKDEANNGAGACIFARGSYFGNFAELIAALAYVKGVKLGSDSYVAAQGGGFIEFVASNPSQLSLNVTEGKLTIGLTESFVKSVNDVIAEVSAIKADYLKASDKEELTELVNDKDAAMKEYVDAEIAKVATSEAFTELEGRVKAIEDDYLKNADKEALQGAINTEKGRIDTLENTTIPALEQSIATEKGRIDVIAPKVETLIGSDANMSARAIVQDEVAKQLQSENITESFDTLKEMAEYLSSHPDTVTEMNNAIKQNADDIDAIEKELENLATSENLGALEVRVKANEDAVATVDTRISTAVSAAEGRVDTKLADYAKTADVNEELGKKANQSDMETALNGKANVGDSYLKAETYTQAEVQAMFDSAFAWEKIG